MDLDQRYTIATNNFIVDRGDGYDFLKLQLFRRPRSGNKYSYQYIEEVTLEMELLIMHQLKDEFRLFHFQNRG